ncbi:GNAT family N-acetyltransferase [Vibrio sp. SM6]|uniref:GNAT family N-acetyltransferase n=1 Tax=Vibrio agarilyticus TaxID=2726741 RepID=A0A7X8YG40_9VIBR|nr:GNAT family N-acetyltransferase [Vibrio agarilyticus]NLS11977.1 GNAT family N-acetyltransferase [Vibrio agarilyticus]
MTTPQSNVNNALETIHCDVIDSAQLPMALLLEADPNEQTVLAYLKESVCFAAWAQQQIVAACVVTLNGTDLKPVSQSHKGVAEILNVSVWPQWQQQGIGTTLLRYVLDQLPHYGVQRVELGTGTFGHQLTYYQRLGFRVDAIWKDHFTRHYPEPILENGIQHHDMLRLSMVLNTAC